MLKICPNLPPIFEGVKSESGSAEDNEPSCSTANHIGSQEAQSRSDSAHLNGFSRSQSLFKMPTFGNMNRSSSEYNVDMNRGNQNANSNRTERLKVSII